MCPIRISPSSLSERGIKMENMHNDAPITEIKLAEGKTPLDIAKFMVQILDMKKAKDIKLLHVEERTVIADYFVIATGNSTTQVSSLCEEVEFRLSEYGIEPMHTEGSRGDSWILSDYASVILHVFSQESRDFYKLEKLYSEGDEVDISTMLTED